MTTPARLAAGHLSRALGPLRSHASRGLVPSRKAAHRRHINTESISHSGNRVQVYTSSSEDPYLNLSVEHHLLQNSHPDSTILFLYINRPSVIFGRNQNPWLEVNLNQLSTGSISHPGGKEKVVDLIRRRSGGGTVFHDEGNVNFSVICPPQAFDRNRHAEMVVRALQHLGKPNVRVNERHDIVLDVEPSSGGEKAQTRKISGSAYKLTRLRSLHHGTCLLQSPNLTKISGLLRSPATSHIKALGSPSVRSPVANVGLANDAFINAVIEEFGRMYGNFDVHGEIGQDAMSFGKISKGYDELCSDDWTYGQTPRFTLSSHVEGDETDHGQSDILVGHDTVLLAT